MVESVTLVSATGTGTGTAEPDRVTVSCSASKVRPTPRAALDEVTELANRTVATLVGVGVDRAALVVSPGHIGQQFHHENGRSVPDGWQAQFSIQSTLGEPALLHAVLEALAGIEDLTINPPQWTVAAENEAWSSARRAAVANALDIARELADAAGLLPGRITSITDGRAAGPREGRGPAQAMMRASAAPPDHGMETVRASASVTIEATPG